MNCLMKLTTGLGGTDWALGKCNLLENYRVLDNCCPLVNYLVWGTEGYGETASPIGTAFSGRTAMSGATVDPGKLLALGDLLVMGNGGSEELLVLEILLAFGELLVLGALLTMVELLALEEVQATGRITDPDELQASMRTAFPERNCWL